ncbi:MAG: hypothetical protein ABWY55_12935 [Microbacterium sp.]
MTGLPESSEDDSGFEGAPTDDERIVEDPDGDDPDGDDPDTRSPDFDRTERRPRDSPPGDQIIDNESTVRVRRGRADQPELDEEPDPDGGSTVVVRRESRRREAAAAAAADLDASVEATAPRGGRRAAPGSAPEQEGSAGRVAHPPESAAPPYASRRPDPVIVPRSAPARHAPQAPVDTAAAEVARRSLARRQALLIVAAASIVTVLAATALVFLAIAG